jgi:hypothetical protein
MDIPGMLFSDTRGWRDLARMHPSPVRVMLLYVVPMSLIPPVMFLYEVIVQKGAVFPALVPATTPGEGLLVAAVFLLAELGMVLLMATLIQQMGELVSTQIRYEEALLFAAIVPTPLWIAPLALFIPSLGMNLGVLALAWLCSVALIQHGVPLLLHTEDKVRASILARHVLVAGVLAWIGLVVVQVVLLSMIMGWR